MSAGDGEPVPLCVIVICIRFNGTLNTPHVFALSPKFCERSRTLLCPSIRMSLVLMNLVPSFILMSFSTSYGLVRPWSKALNHLEVGVV